MVEEINQGNDRGVDFKKMKSRLIRRYNQTYHFIKNLDEDDRSYVSKRRIAIHKLIYLLIALIQLRNGSRISEACEAFLKFMRENKFSDKVIVKIAKSKSTKLKKGTKIKYETKTRFRKMVFPENWIKPHLCNDIRWHLKYIKPDKLRKRVLDYLLNNFNCNTHSLRYAWINEMIFHRKKDMALVAKHIGHSNLSQMITYTQNLYADKLMDEDI